MIPYVVCKNTIPVQQKIQQEQGMNKNEHVIMVDLTRCLQRCTNFWTIFWTIDFAYFCYIY